MRVYEEESFGPVAAIVRVRDTDQAVTVANDTEYGLVAAVFGRDLSRTLTVAQRLAAGVCHINGATVSGEPQLPFGGIKASGFGRFGGKAAIAEFTDLQLVTVQTSAQSYPA
jgi:acyl-CoA reductase-like NAD-dependent aldehyde dehydrogenase